jgi:MFS family permease
MIAGMLAMFFVRDMLGVIVAGTVMMAGMMLTGAAISATVRDMTPKDRIGMVQGLRMIAAILIPMLIGPFIGASVIVGANETFDDLGVTKQVPTPWIFIASAVVAALVVIPVLWLRARPASSGDAS